VRKCLQSWLKTIPFLSAEIGDIFCPGKTGNIEKNFILAKKQSILLAEYIKTDHKKVDLFPSRFFAVFQIDQNLLTI
jgi:hypothetical protein